MNTNWLLDAERDWLHQRYQPMVAKFRQLQREWTVVPFHHSAAAIEYIHDMSAQFQVLCQREADWRMRQYNEWWSAAGNADDAEYAQFCRDQARTYLHEAREWQQEATDSRLLCQEADRARAAYVAYQASPAATLAKA